MAEPIDVAAQAEILSLVTRYWYDVDTNWGAKAHTMFAPDGVFGSGASAYTGHDQIKAFYDWRRSRGERVARHLINNPQVTFEGPDRATIRYIMTIYAVDGVAVLPVTGPNSISDVVELVTRDADGRWWIQSKTFTALFKGPEPTTSMPQHLRSTLLPGSAPGEPS